MKKKNSKNKIIKIVVSIVLSLALIGGSLAYFIAQKETEGPTITSGVLDILFADTGTLRLTNAVPINDADVEDSASEINFNIRNTGTVNMYTVINLEEIVISDLLKIPEFKWALYENDVKVSEGNFSEGESTYELANNRLIGPSKTKKYSIKIWISSTIDDQSSLFGSTFSAKVTAKGYSNRLK